MFIENAALLLARGNEAVEINAPTGADFHITTHGSDWLWAVFSIFALATVSILGLSFTKPKKERLFYHIATLGLIFMSVHYFTIASDLGWAPVQAEFNHVTTDNQSTEPGFRQVFYSRWVAYFLAFPTFFINFAALVGETWSTTMFAITAQELTVIGLLVGSIVHSTYKWGYFVFAIAGFFLVIYSLVFSYRKAALEQSKPLSLHGNIIIAGVSVLFLLYPVAWALSEGGNVIQPDSEAVFYGVLDIFFFVVLAGVYIVFASTGFDFAAHGMHGFQYKVFSSNVASYNNDNTVLPTKEIDASRPSEATEHTHADVEQQV